MMVHSHWGSNILDDDDDDDDAADHDAQDAAEESTGSGLVSTSVRARSRSNAPQPRLRGSTIGRGGAQLNSSPSSSGKALSPNCIRAVHSKLLCLHRMGVGAAGDDGTLGLIDAVRMQVMRASKM